ASSHAHAAIVTYTLYLHDASSDLAGQEHVEAARLLQTLLEFEREGECDRLFLSAADAGCPRVDTTVARINHDAERSGLPNRLLRSEEHTSELQSREKLVCRLLLEK